MPADPAEPRTGAVLAVFAHPDDAEIAAGGTLAKWAVAGREVHLLILTNGDRGSARPDRDRVELAAERVRESEEAAEVLGLASVTVLGTHDGDLENSAAAREPVVRRIREVRAETLLSCDPTSVFSEVVTSTTDHLRTRPHRPWWGGLDRRPRGIRLIRTTATG